MLTVLYDVLKDDELTDFTKLYLVNDFDKVLSLDLVKKSKELDNSNDVDEELVKTIEAKIEERKAAKKEKNFALADKIRDELLNMGIEIKDTREGVVWKKI